MLDSIILLPNIQKQQVQTDLLEVWLSIPQNLYYLNGHFPSLPIVPGVVLLHWVVEFSRKTFNIEEPITLVKNIKFNNLVQPENQLILRIEHIAKQAMIKFSYKADQIIYSSGCVIYS
jgi:3-hydroxymyristoyl/3-hydroxydecanoyl-(acyl carrier protein) dehydratase